MSDIPQVMKGVVMVGHGDYDQLHYRDDLPVPKPGAVEVLVRVEASAVNNTDINTRLAWYSKTTADAQDAGWAGKCDGLPAHSRGRCVRADPRGG